jgi:hypothetical protein
VQQDLVFRAPVKEARLGDVDDRDAGGAQAMLPLHLVAAEQAELSEGADPVDRVSAQGHVPAPDFVDEPELTAEVELTLPERLGSTRARRSSFKPEHDGPTEASGLREPHRSGHQGGQPRRGHPLVVVDEADGVSTGVGETEVAGRVGAGVGLAEAAYIRRSVAKGGKYRLGPVVGPVVDDQYLVPVLWVVLRHEARHTVADKGRSVASRHHDRNKREHTVDAPVCPTGLRPPLGFALDDHRSTPGDEAYAF